MNAHTKIESAADTAKTIKLSSKGQIVIPKDVRDELGWESGTIVKLVRTINGIALQPIEKKRRRLTAAEFDKIVRPHVGVPGTEELWKAAIADDIRRRWASDRC
jgi:AbrB family looped-hinge helix DNA binding protein